ncbi:hypothetical protein CC1G_02522 [Coprinopsis cinerea okayama7|uniref:Uncharacterized protein n=1 Tax=Coprinopsis cinerea (strain Okayama-7 / 130 / ATCC MYA-4618 / FGSC 9003) TaxID=240176 RepID=A8NBR2_COPC7|nr:hypothetical protein CC1G_02522 [Coprinopsis cinerea okayama7\|eukprot:XP_001832260.1 hypothetical protein CC1G_02522 [Coprinopsis cinerea okayama7\
MGGWISRRCCIPSICTKDEEDRDEILDAGIEQWDIYKKDGNTAALDGCIKIFRKLAEESRCRRGRDIQRIDALTWLVDGLLEKCKLSGERSELVEAIQWKEKLGKTLGRMSVWDVKLASMERLADAYLAVYRRSNEPADLDGHIDACRQLVTLSQPAFSKSLKYSIRLAEALARKESCSRSLEESIKILEKVKETCQGTISVPEVLRPLAAVHYRSFISSPRDTSLSHLSHLDKSIQALEELLACSPPPTVNGTSNDRLSWLVPAITTNDDPRVDHLSTAIDCIQKAIQTAEKKPLLLGESRLVTQARLWLARGLLYRNVDLGNGGEGVSKACNIAELEKSIADFVAVYSHPDFSQDPEVIIEFADAIRVRCEQEDGEEAKSGVTVERAAVLYEEALRLSTGNEKLQRGISNRLSRIRRNDPPEG